MITGLTVFISIWNDGYMKHSASNCPVSDVCVCVCCHEYVNVFRMNLRTVSATLSELDTSNVTWVEVARVIEGVPCVRVCRL